MRRDTQAAVNAAADESGDNDKCKRKSRDIGCHQEAADQPATPPAGGLGGGLERQRRVDADAVARCTLCNGGRPEHWNCLVSGRFGFVCAVHQLLSRDGPPSKLAVMQTVGMGHLAYLALIFLNADGRRCWP